MGKDLQDEEIDFSLKDAPEGMKIDRKNGTIYFAPHKGRGEYTTQVE